MDGSQTCFILYQHSRRLREAGWCSRRNNINEGILRRVSFADQKPGPLNGSLLIELRRPSIVKLEVEVWFLLKIPLCLESFNVASCHG